MFDHTSRYYDIETTTLLTATGRMIPYKRRRFLPQGESLPLLSLVKLEEQDRLDHVAARLLGDPEQFWRICDAEDAMNPADLEQPNRVLRVPQPTL